DTTVLADRWDGRQLNSPNDLVYRSDGTLFFTDPPFGLRDEDAAELGFSGVYRVSPVGEIALLTDELAGPNGLAFSPDERWLYVGDWDLDHKAVMRYDPETGDGEVLCDLTDAPGEDAMVLMLGRGEHCPRERQHQREMLRFYEWASVAFTQLVTVLPNDLHDVFRLKISTGAHWTYLADTDLEVQTALDIREYTD